jgi:hypothetical protein
MSTPDKARLQLDIENTWHSRAKARGLAPNTMAYKRAEIEFFTGAMTAINALHPNTVNVGKLSEMVPVAWVIHLVSGRSVTPLEQPSHAG